MLIHTSIAWGTDEEAPRRPACSAPGSGKLQRCPSLQILPDLNPAVSRKSQAEVPGELWPHGLRMIILVPLPAHRGCSSARHACWLICIHSLPHGGHLRCHHEMCETCLEDGTGLAAVLPTALGCHKAALAKGSFSLGKTPWRYKVSHTHLSLCWGMTVQSDGTGGFASGRQAAAVYVLR